MTRWPLLALALLAPAASAQTAAAPEVAHVATSFGVWGLRAHEPHVEALQLEFRPGVRWWWVRPTGGVLLSGEGTQYAFAGVVLEVPLLWGLVVAPGFAPGVRYLDGARNLGFPILFKSSVEASGPLAPGLRALVSFAHVSNAKLGKPNPGIETLLVGLELALE